jgi:site-specific recombinase XerD
MTEYGPSLEQIFEGHIQTLALTLQRTSVSHYRGVTRGFLGYLHAAFPTVHHLSQLRRDPHLLGYFRWLCEKHPPLANHTRLEHLICLRRLLLDLAAQGHPLPPGLIRREDFPPRPKYLPKPLSLQDDERLQLRLRRTNDLLANALLLTRATGIRIGECIHLPLDCLRQLGPEQWALHVPLGKLHTERLVPVDAEGRRLVKRILALRALASPSRLATSEGFLLPRSGPYGLFRDLRRALTRAAEFANCSGPVWPHRLRHYAPSRTMPHVAARVPIQAHLNRVEVS